MAQAKGGLDAAVTTMAFYLANYAMFFFFPWWLFSFALFLKYNEESAGGEHTKGWQSIRTGAASVSLGIAVLSVGFLDSVVAFSRNLPTDLFNGWYLILVGLLSIALLFSGIRQLCSGKEMIDRQVWAEEPEQDS
jgi:hypothetical protein